MLSTLETQFTISQYHLWGNIYKFYIRQERPIFDFNLSKNSTWNIPNY